MQSLKILLMAMFLNMLINLAMMAGNINGNSLTGYLSGMQSMSSSYSAFAVNLKSSNNIVNASFGTFLNAAEGIVNMVIFVAFFISIFFSAILQVPGLLFVAQASYLETFLAVMESIAIVINNIVLVKEVYSIVINRKVEW